MKQEMRCGNCHNRCPLTVMINDNQLVESVSGNACSHGVIFAKEEINNPLKIFVSLLKMEGGIEAVTCVKTTIPIPKEMTSDLAEIIKSMVLHAPVRYGDIIMQNVFDTGADVIIARTILAQNA